MGTNYYLTPKFSAKITKLNSDYNDMLQKIKETYINEVKSIYDEAYRFSSEYKEFFPINDIDDISLYLKYEVEVPEIHICKISSGWVPSFQKCKWFSTYREFLAFYDLHKEIFDITSEYNEIVSIDKLNKDLFKFKNKALPENDRSHYSSNYYVYIKDEDGFDWINVDFS